MNTRFMKSFLLGGALTALPIVVGAHPMGNFAICHYAGIRAGRDRVAVHYVLDLAEIPTYDELRGRESFATEDQCRQYLRERTPALTAGVHLDVNGAPVRLRLNSARLSFLPGAGGLRTMKIALDLDAPVEARPPYAVAYRDDNYPDRTGWKEVVAVAGKGTFLCDSDVPSEDRSGALARYPADVAPPQEVSARFMVAEGAGSAPASLSVAHISNARPSTPRDAFTQAIAERRLTPGLILLGLVIAMVFGAFHALSPGHGKAMVAAYLVGARGTARHAVILGLTVTVTHTLGVFALGLVTICASQYMVPERLYPILSIISGLAVCGVGAYLLIARLRGAEQGHHHDPIFNFRFSIFNLGHRSHSHGLHHHHHDHSHDHDHSHEHSHSHGLFHQHHHHHSNAHEHTHDSGFTPSPLHPSTPSLRSLLALGISGGLVPCPSALVVLLSAIALHRVAYGMALISAFSLGLASVLVAIGLMVVWFRPLLDRLPSGGVLLRRLPVASAAIITCVGVALVARAISTLP